MAAGTNFVEETPERAAESISDALDFLHGEADAAGLSEVSDLIQQASTKSREHGASLSSGAARASAPEPEDASREPEIAGMRPGRRRLRRRYLPLAAAAGAAAIAVALLSLPAQDYEASYQTAIGEHKEIRLPDDSVITLNTNSEVTVRYSGAERRVDLHRGEAHFDVAPAPERPFSVVAGSRTVRAVGTAFNVYLKDDVVEVIVTEGVVEVLPSVPQAAVLAAETLGEGQKLEYRETLGSVSNVDRDEITRKLAWQDGMLDFQGATLAEVIEEAGRYTATQIIIADPEVEGLSVNGYIRAGDVDTLLELIGSNELVTVRRIAPQRVQITATEAPSKQ